MIYHHRTFMNSWMAPKYTLYVIPSSIKLEQRYIFVTPAVIAKYQAQDEAIAMEENKLEIRQEIDFLKELKRLMANCERRQTEIKNRGNL